MADREPLTNRNTNNVLAWRLGEVALEVGHPLRKDVGDSIDRGLILLAALEARGFQVYRKEGGTTDG